VKIGGLVSALTFPFVVFFVARCIVYVLAVVVSFIVVFLYCFCVMCVTCLLYCCTNTTGLSPNCSLTYIYIYIYCDVFDRKPSLLCNTLIVTR
jgi:hypothetical protein